MIKFVLFFSLLFAFSPMCMADELSTLITNLSSRDSDVRREAIRALRAQKYRNNIEVIAPLVNSLRTDTDFINREYAAEVLVGHSSPTGLQNVLETLTSRQYARSHEAASSSIRRINTPEVKEAFLSNVRHTNPDVRRNVVQGLGQFVSDPVVAEKLVLSLRSDTNFLVREYAAESIARLPAAESVPLLAGVLADTSARGRVAAAEGMRRIRSDLVIAPLLSVLRSTNSDLRQASIRGLESRLANATVLDAFFNAHKAETNSFNKSRLLEAVLKTSDPRALVLARTHFRSSDSSDRRYSIDALGRIGDKTDLVALIGLFGHNDESVRARSYDALRAILGRMRTDDPFRTNLMHCLPGVSYGNYSQGTKDTALFMDIFLGGFGLFSAAAHGQRRTVQKLSPKSVKALQDLVKELLHNEDIYE